MSCGLIQWDKPNTINDTWLMIVNYIGIAAHFFLYICLIYQYKIYNYHFNLYLNVYIY